MKKKSLKPRSLLFALCLLGCMQIMAVPEKRTTSFQFFSTFAKKFLPAHYQSPLGKHDGNAKTLRKSGFKFLAPPLRTEEETPDYTVLVMPPPGLVTEKYTLISFILTSDDEMGSGVDMLRRDDHRQELLIGFDGPDVYIQGLSTYFPDAWIKGTLSEDQKTVNIPFPQYLGSRDGEDGAFIDCYFLGDHWANLSVYYNKEDGSFSFPLFSSAEIFEEEFLYYDKENRYEEYEEIGYVSHHYPQIAKGVFNDEVITPPSDMATKEYMLKCDNLYGNKDGFLLNVGFHNDDVYIRGLYPALPDAWIKGKLSGREIIFPKWQFLGESREIGQLIGEEYGLEDIGSKKLYLYGLNLENYTLSDVVFKYDKDNDTMSGSVLAVGASRVLIDLAVFLMQNIVITPMSENVVTPSAPEISEFTMQDSDYAFTFSIPVQDIEGNGMATDLLYYRILTENDGQISTISFNPSEYETLQEMISFIPYRLEDGKYFTSQFSYKTSKTEKKVILKSGLFTSLNKIGVQSVYHGGGTTNESEVSWFTAKDAIELLWAEIETALDYNNDDSKPFGRDDLRAAVYAAEIIYEELCELDEEGLQSYNIIRIIEVIQSLKTAEDEFLKKNTGSYGMISQLLAEIDNAHSLLDDESKTSGRDDLMEAIRHAEQLFDELSNLDEEALKEYDMSIVSDEIIALQEAEQVFIDINWNNLDELESEISYAYQLYYYEDMPYGKEDLLVAIYHAQGLLDEYKMHEGEWSEYDISVINDELYALREAEKFYISLNREEPETISKLKSEISIAYELYYNEDMPYGKEELMEAINHAQELLDEYAYYIGGDWTEYDTSLFLDEIIALIESEKTFIDLNTEWTPPTFELKSEIYNAYKLYYSEDMYYGKEDLLEAINHAQDLLDEYYMYEWEWSEYYVSRFMDEIQALIDAQEAFATINSTIDEDEWLLLKNYYQSANTSSWYQTWDFSYDVPSKEALPGVVSYEGHVIKIDLSYNNIDGTFPYEFLKLPYLEELVLAENRITGDIGEGITQFIQDGNEVSPSIRYLDISGNRLSGNIGIIANTLTGLEYLDASRNYLDEVWPAIPETVTSLYLNNQSIQRVVELNLKDLAEGTLLQSVPNILLYDHRNQSYVSMLDLKMYNNKRDTVSLTLTNEFFVINDSKYAHKAESGALLNACVWDKYLSSYDTSLPLRLHFDQGDADFDGLVNILDLQTQIDYIVEDTYTINFTAANLWKDETINVQDAVCMINLLMDKNPSIDNAGHHIKQKGQQLVDEGNSVFINDGKLFLNMTSPVAAFDIIVSSDNDIILSSELTRYGLTCSVKKIDGKTHLIGYSLSGGTLPEGLTEIGGGLDGEVIYAMLAGKGAREIPVRLNLMPTDIAKSTADMNQDNIKYIIPLGTNRAIFIDSNKKKTIHKTTK